MSLPTTQTRVAASAIVIDAQDDVGPPATTREKNSFLVCVATLTPVEQAQAAISRPLTSGHHEALSSGASRAALDLVVFPPAEQSDIPPSRSWALDVGFAHNVLSKLQMDTLGI